jgi:ataxin-3
MADLVSRIFHEKQEGQLCAQHCINNLLQGEYYTPTDLAEIAKQLDQQELEAMMEGTSPTEQNLFRENSSNNYDDSGFFSIQVVAKALQVWNLDLIPIRSSNEIAKDAKKHPELQDAFICNLDQHWYALKKFGNSSDRWYNLNSTLKQPKHISSTYLVFNH